MFKYHCNGVILGSNSYSNRGKACGVYKNENYDMNGDLGYNLVSAQYRAVCARNPHTYGGI